MKRIQIIIPVLLGAFCTGCDLDIEPQDRYDQQTFWYSAKAAEGGLTGCYNALLENGIYEIPHFETDYPDIEAVEGGENPAPAATDETPAAEQ